MNRILRNVLFFLGTSQLVFQLYSQNQPKIVGLITVKNEQIFIEQCLKALAMYTDAIVLLDDASTDNTVKIVESIAQECRVEKILVKKEWHRDEPGDKNMLLDAGRSIGGTHFILIDADEMFTANCSRNNYLRRSILALKPGQRMLVWFFNLWRSHEYYRDDQSPWKPRFIDCAFCDDGTCYYESINFIHTSHIPKNLDGETIYLNNRYYGLMHFQFINWRNLLVKQAWYRCLELIRDPKKSPRTINKLYAPSKNEADIQLSQVRKIWLKNYTFFDPSIFEIREEWRENQILAWFKQYGKPFFKKLDIWDIDWNNNEA